MWSKPRYDDLTAALILRHKPSLSADRGGVTHARAVAQGLKRRRSTFACATYEPAPCLINVRHLLAAALSEPPPERALTKIMLNQPLTLRQSRSTALARGLRKEFQKSQDNNLQPREAGTMKRGEFLKMVVRPRRHRRRPVDRSRTNSTPISPKQNNR